MSHRGTALLLALFLGLAPSLPVAARPGGELPPMYQVELVIFARDDLSDAAREVWPTEPGRPEFEAFRELEPMEPPPLSGTGAEGEATGESGTVTEVAAAEESTETMVNDLLEKAWRILPSGEHRLADAVARLERSGRYRILFHEAWRQPVAERGGALPILLRAGEERAAVTEEGGIDAEELLSEAQGYAPITSEAMDLEDDQETSAPLEGVITISRGRYLHLQTDLLYHRWLPVMTESGGIVEERRVDFRMRQHRRMRSREIHYLDHPVLGILVLFTPWEAEAGKAQEGNPEGADSRRQPVGR